MIVLFVLLENVSTCQDGIRARTESPVGAEGLEDCFWNSCSNFLHLFVAVVWLLHSGETEVKVSEAAQSPWKCLCCNYLLLTCIYVFQESPEGEGLLQAPSLQCRDTSVDQSCACPVLLWACSFAHAFVLCMRGRGRARVCVCVCVRQRHRPCTCAWTWVCAYVRLPLLYAYSIINLSCLYKPCQCLDRRSRYMITPLGFWPSLAGANVEGKTPSGPRCWRQLRVVLYFAAGDSMAYLVSERVQLHFSCYCKIC